jgi:hypothetical protein
MAPPKGSPYSKWVPGHEESVSRVDGTRVPLDELWGAQDVVVVALSRHIGEELAA